MHASEPLDEVLDEALLRLPNAILHGYSYRNRMICSRIEWGVGKMHWSIFAAPSDKVVLVADGSGRGYVQGIASADHAQWSAMEQSVGDWRAVRDYALRLFRAVTSLDRAVGPDVDTWVMTKDDRVWRRPDAPERGETS